MCVFAILNIILQWKTLKATISKHLSQNCKGWFSAKNNCTTNKLLFDVILDNKIADLYPTVISNSFQERDFNYLLVIILFCYKASIAVGTIQMKTALYVDRE